MTTSRPVLFETENASPIAPEGLSLIAEKAFKDVSHLLRPSHLEAVEGDPGRPEASSNDRYVALEMLKNAVISAEGVLPMCQDTGTAVVIGKKGQQVWTGYWRRRGPLQGDLFGATPRTTSATLRTRPSPCTRRRTRAATSLPRSISMRRRATPTGFSSSQREEGPPTRPCSSRRRRPCLTLPPCLPYLIAKMKTLGTAACPPYHLAFVIGGTSAETNLKTVKLASAGYLDTLPGKGRDRGVRLP